MFPPELVLRSRRVVTPRGTRPAAIHVRGGRIIGIVDIDDVPSGCPVDDAGEHVVIPGLVDAGVHVSGGGRTVPEGFEAVTRLAAAGGVTTVIVMPFDSVRPATSAGALESTRRDADGHCFVDVGFWGGVCPGNAGELGGLFEAGVLGFHCDLGAPGVDDSLAVSETDLRAAMPALARLGALLVAHAELPGPIVDVEARQHARRTWRDRLPGLSRRSRRYATYLEGRPKAAENEAVARLIQICRESRLPIHIAHLSSSDALTPIFHARSARLPLSAETCPHYLYFVAEEVPDGAAEYRCAPPIRERANRELLWAALGGGLIQSVASDHRSRPIGSSGLLDARGGIASLDLGLSIVWTEARARGHTLEQIVRWMCRAPAHLAGLARKGQIDVGYDADLVVFDPDAESTVEPDPRRGLTPYRGCRLRGVVQRTYVRGTRAYENRGLAPEACGRFLLRPGSPRVY